MSDQPSGVDEKRRAKNGVTHAHETSAQSDDAEHADGDPADRRRQENEQREGPYVVHSLFAIIAGVRYDS